MAVSTSTVSTSTASTGTVSTSRAARPDALSTPWTGSLVRRPDPAPVTFSDLPAVRDGSSATGASSVETPWQDAPIAVPAPPPGSFSSLPAPTVTARRPEPLTVRSAFVPRPRVNHR